MKTLKESILSSTKTGKSGFLIPKTKEELIEMIANEIKEKGITCDLNHIKTHNITDMSDLFNWSLEKINGIRLSYFKGDISQWDVSNVTNSFDGNISKLDVSKVKNMKLMFERNGYFNNDISNWKINPKCNTNKMFYDCKIKNEYKPKKNGKVIE